MDSLIMQETSYGVKKRLDFICNTINSYIRKKSINSTILCMDVGSGVGDALLLPLCKKYPNIIEFVSIEPDDDSRKILNEAKLKLNVNNFYIYKSLDECFKYYKKEVDILIISEVLEHVENPCNFLKSYITALHDNGILILTIPNGFGFFEIDQLLFKIGILLKFNILISVSLKFLKRIYRKFRYKPVDSFPLKGSVAISPHIQFFSFNKILFLLKSLGLELLNYKGRTFMCGPITSRFINKFNSVIKLNNALGSVLPPYLVSGWMFVFLKKKNIRNINCKELNKKLYSNILAKLYRKIKIFLNKKVPL